MRSCLRPLLLLTTVASLAACGSGRDDGNGNGNGSGGGAVTAATFPAKAQTAICSFAKRCVPELAHEICSEQGAGLGDVDAEVKAGRLDFDAAKAQTCLDAFATVACPATLSGDFMPADCNAVLVPKVQAGGDCYLDDECVGGSCDSATCPGHCVAFAATGQSCASAECASGDFCDDNQTCQAQLPAGGSCTDDGQCAVGRCLIDPSTGDGTCGTPTGKTGASCNGDGDCADGFFCHGAGFGASGPTPGTCTAFLAKGASCGGDGFSSEAMSACGPKLACAGFYVTLNQTTGAAVAHDGTCADWQDAGGSCTTIPATADIGLGGCMFGLACDATGHCGNPPSSGPCGKDETGQCADGSFCDQSQTPAVCASTQATCTSPSDCGGKACTNGVCAAACTP